jgi:tRNA pseudouridine55 synthase
MPTESLARGGILIIDKPSGWTSHDVVNKARRILGIRRIGHAGTLDPLATGVLVLLVGSATKRSDELTGQDKTYQATVSFGQQTDTGDADGVVIHTDDASWLTEDHIYKALPKLLGTREQMVPAYSAVKIKGNKLYDLARAGQVLTERPVRTITIKRIELESFDPTPPFPSAVISVDCSKGTYIRVLAEEIGQIYGVAAHLTALRRIASGAYPVDRAVNLETLSSASDPWQFVL